MTENQTAATGGPTHRKPVMELAPGDVTGNGRIVSVSAPDAEVGWVTLTLEDGREMRRHKDDDLGLVGTFEGRTAEEWRAMAAGNYQRAAESWERSDTDGFLSQWASNTVAREYELKAELAENNGLDTFRALFDLEGNRVWAHEVETQFGYSWRLFDKDTNETVGWFNESKARNEETAKKNNAKKGVYVGTVRTEARVLSAGTAVSVHYYTAPRDKYMLEAEVVDNGR